MEKALIRIDKVWGFEQVICNTEHYCSKFLHVKPGMQCSLHYHKLKDETFFVLSGNVFLTVGDNGAELREGERVHIPPGTPHRFASKDGCILIETSTHHEDGDVVRLESSMPMRALPARTCFPSCISGRERSRKVGSAQPRERSAREY